jgi:signal-transduction protein with cAMP-binding, CBS, and nucleotidyltransferase domain
VVAIVMFLSVAVAFLGFAVADKINDRNSLKRFQELEDKAKKLEEELRSASKTICGLRLENQRYQEDNEKLGYLINDLCKAYDIPIEDFKKFREKHNI